MRNKTDQLIAPALVAMLSGGLLTVVKILPDESLLVLDRFFPWGGWLQIVLLSIYGFIVMYCFQDPARTARWRIRIWLIFSIYFFIQFGLGLWVNERFLMTGNLHLPIPFMILGGPLYRMQFSVMTIIFLVAIVLSGPAWCSYFCYFGAWDGLAAKKHHMNGKQDLKSHRHRQVKGNFWRYVRNQLNNNWFWKIFFLILVILGALIFRFLGLKGLSTLIPALFFGLTGVGIMFFISGKMNIMVHCTTFCPIGTIVNLLKFISPFRIKIDRKSCDNCMRCIPSCYYDALKPDDIRKKRPGLTCTLCGDCVSSCRSSSIQYALFGLSPEVSRKVFLVVVVTLYILCVGLARM